MKIIVAIALILIVPLVSEAGPVDRWISDFCAATEAERDPATKVCGDRQAAEGCEDYCLARSQVPACEDYLPSGCKENEPAREVTSAAPACEDYFHDSSCKDEPARVAGSGG